MSQSERSYRIVAGIERVLVKRTLCTRNLGGNASTEARGKAVEDALG